MRTAYPTQQQIVAVSSDSIAEFIDDLTSDTQDFDGRDRRSEKQYLIAVPVALIPIDGSGLQLGAGRTGVTRNIPESSIAIYLTAAFDGDFVLLTFERPENKAFSLVAQVTRRRRIGPYWEIVGRFVGPSSFDGLLRLFLL